MHQFVTSTTNVNFAAMLKRDYFAHFNQGKEITIDAIQLHAIKADTVQSAAPNLDPTTPKTNQVRR